MNLFELKMRMMQLWTKGRYQDSDGYSASEFEIDDHEMAPEWENAALSLRLLESPARGRPIARMRSESGFPLDPLSDGNPIYNTEPVGPAVNTTTIEQFWDFLFTPNVIQMHVEHTNELIEEHCASLIDTGADTQTYLHHTDEEEEKVFIGILYIYIKGKVSNEVTWNLINEYS
ncbi:hypothetical protein HHI36_014271, partial [Cryptolaemus montrouzieri]